jgi:hypothetical protein
MFEEEKCKVFGVDNLNEEDKWGKPGVDGKIILREVFRKWDVVVWAGSRSLKIGTVGRNL